MNEYLRTVLRKTTPKFSQTTGGPNLDNAIEYLDSIVKSSMRSMTKKLVYHGITRITVEEEYATLYSNTIKKPYDVTPTSMYKVKFMFSYDNQELDPVYIWLPYTRDGGIITISGSDYHLSPILSDTVISPGKDRVFVRLIRDKLQFLRKTRTFSVHNEGLYSGNIIYSDIYTSRNTSENRIVPPAGLYILTHLGFRKTFKKYSKITPIIIKRDEIGQYEEDYRIYTTNGVRPTILSSTLQYIPHDLCVCVKNEQVTDMTAFDENLISSFLYTLDHFPDSADNIYQGVKNENFENEKITWYLLLGKTIFDNSFKNTKILSDLKNHLKSIDSYVDQLITEKLSEIGVIVNDFYDLLAHLLDRFSGMVLNSKTNNTSDRYMDIYYYILYDIIYGINSAFFGITNKSREKNDQLNISEVNSVLKSNLNLKKIYNIIAGGRMNLTLWSVDSASDNKQLKITCKLELQERGSNVSKAPKAVMPASLFSADSMETVVGSIYGIPKKHPSGMFTINPFCDVDEYTGRINMDDRDMMYVEALNTLLQDKK